MPYVTSIERLALKKERGKGLLEGIESVLEIRFGAAATASTLTKIRELSSVEILRKILQAAKTIDRPENLEDLWSVESEE